MTIQKDMFAYVLACFHKDRCDSASPKRALVMSRPDTLFGHQKQTKFILKWEVLRAASTQFIKANKCF